MIKRLVTLRNIRKISCNKDVLKAWLNSLVVSKQVSSCWEEFSVSVEQMLNLVCVEWKCSSVEQSVGAKKTLGAKQRKCSMCRASVNLVDVECIQSGCRAVFKCRVT